VHCRRWCEQSRTPEGELDVTRWTQAALQQAARDIDHWLDHLTRCAAPAGANITAHKGLVALALPAALEQCPESFLSFDRVPDALLQKLRAPAAAPVVPPCAGHNPMGGPGVEELLPELKSSRSQRIYEAFMRLMQGK
jgi:soluble lytic murein transglycosylase-like protein